MQELAVR